MIGTGPYRFVTWTRGERLEMERFENYWGEKPEFERVTMRFIPNPTTRTATLRLGCSSMLGASG